MEKSIVCIHGRAQEWQLEDALQRVWRDAIRAGMKRSQVGSEILSDDHIILAFYGDYFRPDADDGRKGPLMENAAFEEGLAKELIQEAERRGQIDRVVWEKSIAEDVEDTEEKGSGAKLKPLLQLLDRLPGFSGFLLRSFVQDVDRYLHIPDFRARIIDHVATKIKVQQEMGREVILVTHSLGTVVAYDVLNTRLDISVSSFITLGSPLGVKSYIYKALLPIQNQHPFPSTVTGDWSNFYDVDDIVALIPELAPLFQSTLGKMIKTTQVYNRPDDHHSLTDYLSSKQVGLAIYTALR